MWTMYIYESVSFQMSFENARARYKIYEMLKTDENEQTTERKTKW